MQWLVRYLGRHRTGNEPWRSQIDAAITAAKFYGRLKQQLRETDADFAERRDESWDRVLDALDFHLRARQIQHPEDVAQGGASGPEVDRKLKEMRTGEDACDCPDSVSSPDQQPRRGASPPQRGHR